jgi:uncharacterized protein (TIGR03437 family)
MRLFFSTRLATRELLLLSAATLLAPSVVAQTAISTQVKTDWRRIGTLTIAEGLASPSSGGAVVRVHFLEDGRLQVALTGGRAWQTADGESWTPAESIPIAERSPSAFRLPEAGAVLRESKLGPALLFAGGSQLWRSEDSGRTWRDLTQTRVGSVLGAAVNDLAVDPENSERVAVAAASGVWVSLDGGLSWQGWNDGLPAFRVTRILAAPAGGRGMQVLVRGEGASKAIEWAPGFRLGWLPASVRDTEEALKTAFALSLHTKLSAAAEGPGVSYAGSEDGRLWSSMDGGTLWQPAALPSGSGSVGRIVSDLQDGRFALATLASTTNPNSPGVKGARVLRTLDGGANWDDLTSDLPDGPVQGIAFDRPTGAVYAATSQGVYLSYQGLRAPEPAARWTLLRGLPDAPAMDVRLDEAGVRVFAAVDGYGIYESPAPHRARQPLLLRAADYATGPAAPGALLTIVGSAVDGVTVNSQPGVVLSSNALESQIQVPFQVSGDSLRIIASRTGAASLSFGLPLRQIAPAILTDGDGFPVIIDANSGIQIDALNPVRPGARLQILATGLGRVQPNWPEGMAAPADHPPAALAGLRVFLDGVPMTVVRSVLAPGYVGFYLVEFDAPEFLDSGVAEIVIEGAGQTSNAVRVYMAAQ